MTVSWFHFYDVTGIKIIICLRLTVRVLTRLWWLPRVVAVTPTAFRHRWCRVYLTLVKGKLDKKSLLKKVWKCSLLISETNILMCFLAFEINWTIECRRIGYKKPVLTKPSKELVAKNWGKIRHESNEVVTVRDCWRVNVRTSRDWGVWVAL